MLQTVSRAITVIEFLGQKPRTLSQVADHLGTHKSTALRLLQTLEHGGFARQDTTGRYTVGFKLVEIAHRVLDDVDLYSVAHSRLAALSEHLGHTLHLAHLVGRDVVYLDKVDGSGAVKMYSRIGTNAILHTAAVAKAILAYTDEPLRSDIISTIDYSRYTATTLTSREDFEKDLERTAERGWAEDNSEFEDFVNCVAVPIRGSNRQVRAAVSLTALRALAPLEVLRASVDDLLTAAQDISRECGWAA